MDARRRERSREDNDTDGTRCGEAIGPEAGDRGRVRRISRERMYVGRDGVENTRIDVRRAGTVQVRKDGQPRVANNTGRCSDLDLVVAEAVTAADHEFVVE